MGIDTSWRKDSKCQRLNANQCDAIFFPGRGAKSKRAKIYCSSCPVRQACLEEAIETGVEGFWAGTTYEERLGMRRFKDLVAASIAYVIPELPRRPKLRPITSSLPDKSLDEVQGPSPLEEFQMIVTG